MMETIGFDLRKEQPLCHFKVGGLQKFTLIDYPGKPACIIFTQGCNFRCGYCYNVELVLPERFEKPIPLKYIIAFLEERVSFLEGVVITGGEPTIQKGLYDFVKTLKDMGYAVKLDTNGSMPHVIEELLKNNLLDYIAMDVKAPVEKYNHVIGVKFDVSKVLESIELIMSSGVDYEFRTTVVKEQLSIEDILSIAELIKNAKRYFLQRFISAKTLDPSFSLKSTYTDEEFNQIIESIKPYFSECGVR